MLLKAPRNISEVIRTRTWLFPIFHCDNTGEQSWQDQLQALKPIQYPAPWRDELRPPSPRWASGLTCGAVGGCSHRGPLWPASQILLLFFRVWSLSCRCLGAVLITFRGAGGTARSDLQQQQQRGENQRVPIGYLFVPSPTSPAPGSARCPGNYVSQAPLPFGFHLDEALGRHWQKPGGRGWGRSQGINSPSASGSISLRGCISPFPLWESPSKHSSSCHVSALVTQCQSLVSGNPTSFPPQQLPAHTNPWIA